MATHVLLLGIISFAALAANFLFATAAVAQETTTSDRSKNRPNILIILADDLGISDLGCYGGEISTPRIDALAANGLRFRQFYNCTRCCPSRASLLTGLYPHQAGVGAMTNDRQQPGYRGFPQPNTVTIAEALKSAGYHTSMVGKWHLSVGGKPPFPTDRGFDEFYGMIGGYNSCFEEQPYYSRLPKDRVKREYAAGAFYSTDAFADYSLDFIELARREKRPFFQYLAFNAPHFPLHAKPEDIAKYKETYRVGWDKIREERLARQKKLGLMDEKTPLTPLSDYRHPFAPTRHGVNPAWDTLDKDRQADLARRMAVYAGMIDCLDRAVGRIVDRLRENNELDNTLIFFLSDNGACAEWDPLGFDADSGPKNILHTGPMLEELGAPKSYISYGSGWANACNTPFRLYKHYCHEGGIRTPLVVHWPKQISARGEFRDQMGHLIDLMTTCVDVAGAKYPESRNGIAITPMEGRSLVPAFSNRPVTRDYLAWEHEHNRAIRAGDWKLVSRGSEPWQLYDMKSDCVELHDQAESQPEKVKQLSSLWNDWANRTNVLSGTERRKAESGKRKMDQPPAAYSNLTPLPFTAVRIDDAFWGPRMETVQKRTIPDLLDQSASRIKNFAIIAGQEQGKIFLANSPDSDLYKILEAASYSLAWRADPKLDARLDAIIAKIAAAQAPDGYLNTQYMLPLGHPASPNADEGRVKRYGYGPDQMWKGRIEEWPRGIGQLYCAGHLFEAAAAHFHATHKRNFLDVAIKLADNACRAFPVDQPIHYADHPQFGIGLIKLYEVTGDRKYLRLADHIVHHGHHARPPDLGDRESWKPIEQQRQAWGHAVRIHYLFSEATDLCRYLDQPDTRVALDSLWHSIVDKRIYLHGGVGGPANLEQMAGDYHLDNEQCYCECCANIAHGQWNHRLNLMLGDAKYADLVEHEVYNGGLCGISLEGTEYFYSNKLAVGKEGRAGRHAGVRERYIFCCPTKLPGFVGGISRWVYAQDERGVYVNLYLANTADIHLKQGELTLRQETKYPWEGNVKLTVNCNPPVACDVCLRIPGWVSGKGPMPTDLYRYADKAQPRWRARVNGVEIPAPQLDLGYLRIHRQWKSGDVVELELPMNARRVEAHEKVEANKDRIALVRGPIVYCLEGVDHDASVLKLALSDEAVVTTEFRRDLLGGVTVLRGNAIVEGRGDVPFVAVPYYAWENRGVHEMNVWLHRATGK